MQRTYPAPTKSRAKASRFVPSNIATWLLLGGGLAFFLLSVTISALIAGALVIYESGRILPGVSAAGVRVGGLSVDAAADALKANWSQIAVRDGNRLWQVTPEQLGLTLDASATALEAQHQGRGDGAVLSAMISDSIAPVVTI